MPGWFAPRETAELLGNSEPRQIENLWLRLYALLPLVRREGGAPTESFHQIAAGSIGPADLLTHLAQRQSDAVEAFCSHYKYRGVGPLTLELTSRFTCGLSQRNALENGMSLLRPWGIPFVPASAVKGVLSSWLAAILAGSLRLQAGERDAVLEASGFDSLFGFGDRSDRLGAPGLVEFYDALPQLPSSTSTGLRVDGTTVHYRSWYTDEVPSAPDGTDNPVPVPFLSVERGTRFTFVMAVSEGAKLPAPDRVEPCDAKARLAEFGIPLGAGVSDFLVKLLVSAARYHGFGSQVRKGYGRMQLVPQPGAAAAGSRVSRP